MHSVLNLISNSSTDRFIIENNNNDITDKIIQYISINHINRIYDYITENNIIDVNQYENLLNSLPNRLSKHYKNGYIISYISGIIEAIEFLNELNVIDKLKQKLKSKAKQINWKKTGLIAMGMAASGAAGYKLHSLLHHPSNNQQTKSYVPALNINISAVYKVNGNLFDAIKPNKQLNQKNLNSKKDEVIDCSKYSTPDQIAIHCF